MTPKHITEPNYNHALAEQLQRRLPGWEVTPQSTGVLEHVSQQPDVFIELPNGLPVVVECKYDLSGHAKAVAAEAVQRLGRSSNAQDHQVEQAVAVLYPAELRLRASGLEQALADTTLRYAAFSNSPGGPVRFPTTGWLQGGLDSLADLIENIAVDEPQIQDVRRQFERAITTGANRLVEFNHWDSPTIQNLAQVLRQPPGEQTTRMAVTIMLNALVFQANVADKHTGIQSVTQLLDQATQENRRLTQSDVLLCWREIINEINYRSVFVIAADALSAISSEARAAQMLEVLVGPAQQLASLTTQTVQDLAGQVLGRLVSDRKLLGTFYTPPPTAALLAGLAINRLTVDWGDQQAIEKLQIADVACGTGALLSAAQRQIFQRARRQGINDEKLHKALMEDMLVGADVLPAAVHITTTMLAAAHPKVPYDRTRTHIMPYGRQPDGSVRLGSLHLLQAARNPTLWDDHTPASGDSGNANNNSNPSGDGGPGEPIGISTHLELPRQSLDLVIMNPPVTRKTAPPSNQTGPTSTADFTEFGLTEADRRDMAAALRQLPGHNPSQTASHSQASLTIHFTHLALELVKPGGVIALVLPAAFATAAAWSQTRTAIAQQCTHITLVTLTGADSQQQSFSADTARAELLLIATRRDQPLPDTSRQPEDWRWVTLTSRPDTPAAAAVAAAAIHRTPQGTLRLGPTAIGTATPAPYGTSPASSSNPEPQQLPPTP